MKALPLFVPLLAVVATPLCFHSPAPTLGGQDRGQAARKTDAEPRIALVIGNSAYAEGPLANPINDARDMAATLGQLGFSEVWESPMPGGSDLHGNVWEWCEDDWHSDSEGAPTDGRAWVDIPNGASYQVFCGSGWSSVAVGCRSANRDFRSPFLRSVDLGFRFSRTAQ